MGVKQPANFREERDLDGVSVDIGSNVDTPAKPKLQPSQDPVPDMTYSHDLLHGGKQDANVTYPLAIQDSSPCPTT